MPSPSLGRPSSRQELPPDDEELLADAASPITASSPPTSGQDTAGLAEPLPPLNLASAIAYSSARAKVTPQQSQLQASQAQQSFSIQPTRAHKSSFSVPPSSRAVNTFSVVDSDDPDALHARTANYETLLRQFALKRPASRLHAYQTPAALAFVARPSRLQRGSSAEDLRLTLTRLGSSLSLDRIRRRSNEGSSISISHATAAVAESEAPHDATKRRISLARSVRRLRNRLELHLRSLLEPLSPLSSVSSLRHVVVLILLLVQLLYLPFAVSFLHDDSVGLLIHTNIALELVWLLDLGLTFNTAIIVDDPKASGGRVLVATRSQIAHSYIHRTFVLDALASLPLETVASLVRSSSTPLLHSHPTLYYVGSSLRLLKFRLVPLSLAALQRSPFGQWLSRTQYRHRYVSTMTVVLEVLLLLVVAVHYLACGWYAVMPSASFALVQGELGATYVHALVDVSLLISGDGVVASRIAETTTTIAGHSTRLRVHLFLLLVLLLGVVLSAFAFARLAIVLLLDTLVHQERDGAYHLERSLAALSARMDKLRLPEALQDRVKQYFTHLSHEYGVVDGRESSLFHFSQSALGHSRMLSAPLALEVALCRYTATLGRMNLWKGCSADLMSALIVRVEPRVYLKDDFVRRKGEISTELLIVQRGTCEYMAPSQSQGLPDDHRAGAGRASPLKSSSAQQQRLLSVGASLGQLALIVDYKFPVYVRAVSHLEVGIVGREVFQELVNRFVDDRERLVRRIFRTGLEGAEHPALWQLVNRFHAPPPTTAGATVSGNAAGGGVTVAVATRPPPPLVQSTGSTTVSTTSDRRISTREAAKTLVRVLEISTMPSHARLSLPLVLEPEALRGRTSHRTLSISTRSGAAPVQRTQTNDQPPVATAAAAATSATATAVTATVAAETPAQAEAETDKTPTDSGCAESQVLLDELAQTQSALLHLVQNLTDAVTRLDAKVSRMEDTARYAATSTTHHGLLRRRSSHMDSEEHVLLRRRSSYNGSDDRERDASSYDWRDGSNLQVPRMLPPEEMAVLRANAMAAALGRKSETGESRPPSSAYTDRQTTRFQSSRVSEVPQSTFDEEALTLRGVYMLSQLTSRSTPPTSSREASSRAKKALATGPRTRSRSLSTTTRLRLNAFQTSLQQAITSATLATPASTEPPDQRRRASLSTMWTRAKPP